MTYTKLGQQIPSGKRTVRRTVRGSLNGYVGRKFWCCFGEAFDSAANARAALFLANI